MKIDLHVHTIYSDGWGLVEEVLQTARARGLDGLAITDHETLWGYYKASSICGEMLVIPGFEVDTDAGHVLVLGLEQLPPPSARRIYERLVRWARGLGGVTVLAHPAAHRLRLDRWSRCKPDAVEVLNALYPLQRIFVSRGRRIAHGLKLPAVGGSDAHQAHNVGDAYTLVEVGNPTKNGVLEAIRTGSVTFEGSLSPRSPRLRRGLGYLIRRLLALSGLELERTSRSIRSSAECL
jgi:predicted metal-dependent phosphoesterase TrpH